MKEHGWSSYNLLENTAVRAKDVNDTRKKPARNVGGFVTMEKSLQRSLLEDRGRLEDRRRLEEIDVLDLTTGIIQDDEVVSPHINEGKSDISKGPRALPYEDDRASLIRKTSSKASFVGGEHGLGSDKVWTLMTHEKV